MKEKQKSTLSVEEVERLPALLSVDDVAQMAGVTDRYIRSVCSKGKLKAKRVGRYWRIPKQSALEFVGLASEIEMVETDEHAKVEPELPHSFLDGVVSRWLLRSIDWVFSNFDPRARPLRIKALVVVAQMARTDRTHNGKRIAVVALSVLSKRLNIPIRSAQRIVKDLTTEGAPLSVVFKQQGNNKSGTCYALTGTGS